MALSQIKKNLIVISAVSALAFSTACASDNDAVKDAEVVTTVALETDEDKASYGIGYGYAKNLKEQTAGLELSVEAMVQGIRDAMSDGENALTEEEIQNAIAALQQKQAEAQQSKTEAAAAEAQAAGIAFLTENATKDGIQTTESGLQYEIITRSDSEERPAATNTVKVHYHGTLINGTVFDSSIDRGEPIEFPLNQVIAGWTEGVQLMAVGDKFRFFIPAELAYGDAAAGPIIAPGSTLIFEVELLEII